MRVYAAASHRGDRAHEVDAALLRLVRGLVPVPGGARGATRRRGRRARPRCWSPPSCPGVRGDELLPTLDDAGLARFGTHLGALLADLGGMPMLRAGAFVDGDLSIGALPGPDGLPEWVAAHETALAGLSRAELAGLREVAYDAQVLLDTVDRRCLVHSDVNPKNLLVDPGTLEITGLVDWEFAHAGHPFTDLGNVVRFDRAPAYVDAVLASYTERRGGDPDSALALARAADLWALVDLAARHANAPQNLVAALAFDLLRTIGQERDVHAAPERGVSGRRELDCRAAARVS